MITRNTVIGTRNVPSVDANAVATLQRTKQKDGNYIITLPINTSDEVITNFQTGETLTDRLIHLNNRSMGILQDLSTLVLRLSHILGSDLTLNNIYREDFATDENILVQEGVFNPGSISNNGSGITFQLKRGIVSSLKPILVTIKDIKSIIATLDNVVVTMTVNALDTDPLWFDCTEQYINGTDITIPIEYQKEADTPWCINVKFQFIDEGEMSISDLVIAHI